MAIKEIKVNEFPESIDPKNWVVVADANGVSYKISKENLKAYLGTGITPEVATSFDLGAPPVDRVYYGGEGNYTLDGTITTVEAPLNIFVWNKISWSVLEVPIDLVDYIREDSLTDVVYSKNKASHEFVVNDVIIGSAGNIAGQAGSKILQGVPVIGGRNYVLSGLTPADNKYFFYADENGVKTGDVILLNSMPKNLGIAPSDATSANWTVKVLAESDNGWISTLQLEEGTVATDYEVAREVLASIAGVDVLNPDTPIFSDLKNKVSQIDNLIPIKKDEIVPFDKSSIALHNAGSSGSSYGFSDTFFYNNDLEFIYVNAMSSGGFVIEFRILKNGQFELLHTYNSSSLGAGLITIPVHDLGLPELPEWEKVYLFVGNTTDKSPNVMMYSNGDPYLRDWYVVDRLTGAYNTYNSYVTFGFWIKVKKIDSEIVSEVLRIKSKVDSEGDINISNIRYDFNENFPLLPSQIYLLDDRTTPLYSKSMFQKLENRDLPDVLLRSNDKSIAIQDPTNISSDDVGSNGQIFVNKNSDISKLLFKDIEIIKGSLSDKIGQTVSVMSLGDSLTEGGDGSFNSSPIYLLAEGLTNMGITVQGIGTLQRTSGVITQQYEGRGGWRYRTFVGLESKFSAFNVVIPSPNKRVWIEGIDGSIEDIKANQVFLYVASAQDKINYPEWCFNFVNGSSVDNVSYAQNPNLGTYYIFDPARYLSQRGIGAPDILTIALGTNEWYLPGYSGWDLTLISSCAEWMIERFRQAMPATKIVIIPCNNFPLSREKEWQEKASYLTASIMKICENKRKAGDNNLFTLSIFAHGSRSLAHNAVLNIQDLSSINSVKIGDIDSDVHVLSLDDDSRNEYMQSLINCVGCIM